MNTNEPGLAADLRANTLELRRMIEELQALREALHVVAEELRGRHSTGGLLQKLAGKLGV